MSLRSSELLRSIGGYLSRLWRAETGAVAAYVALGTMMFIPLVGISVELVRLQALHTELQQAAEAAALAAAAELDFTDAGLAAAQSAAREAVTNFELHATDTGDQGPQIDITTIEFLWGLPPAPETNYADYVTTVASETRYVRVTSETREHRSSMMEAFLTGWGGGDPDDLPRFAVGAAVAGRTAVACRTLPLMMCNPVEANNEILDSVLDPGTNDKGGYDLYGDFLRAHPQWTRNQFRIKWIGPDTSYGAGTFGLLEPRFSSDNGAKGIEDELALGTPSFCVALNGASVDPDIKTGQAQTIVDGINVRFDIYRGNWNKETSSSVYPPAPNVIKGMLPKGGGGGKGNVCNPNFADEDEEALKLPQDNCFTAETAAELAGLGCFALGTQDGDILTPGKNKGFAGRYGNGQWDIVEYFSVNHPSKVSSGNIDTTTWSQITSMEQSIATDNEMPMPPAPTLAQPASRYSVYKWEIDQNQIPGAQTRSGTTPEEEGQPQCNGANAVGDDRRLLYIAVVNCIEYQEELEAHGTVPVMEFAEAFATEPADANGTGGLGDKGAIYVEIPRTISQGSSSNVVLRDIVQLY